MALFLNGKQLQCGNAIAAKPWTTLGTLTEGGSSLNVSGYTELLIYPKINGTTYFDPIVIDVSEFNNASTIHFSIYQDNSHSYMGGLDYSEGSVSFRKILISGWVSCDCVVKATCFSSGGSTTHHYSTDEQIVGTWIDGSALYEKVFVSTTTPTANTWTDISLGDINVIDFKAYIRRTGGFVDVFDGTGSTLVGCIRTLTNDTVFEYKVDSAYISNFIDIIITVKYTKLST